MFAPQSVGSERPAREYYTASGVFIAIPCFEQYPRACHSERSEESGPSVDRPGSLEILRSAQNDI